MLQIEMFLHFAVSTLWVEYWTSRPRPHFQAASVRRFLLWLWIQCLFCHTRLLRRLWESYIVGNTRKCTGDQKDWMMLGDSIHSPKTTPSPFRKSPRALSRFAHWVFVSASRIRQSWRCHAHGLPANTFKSKERLQMVPWRGSRPESYISKSGF